jgi:hypothetical protein
MSIDRSARQAEVALFGRAHLVRLTAAAPSQEVLDEVEDWRSRAKGLAVLAEIPEGHELWEDFFKLARRLRGELPQRESAYQREHADIDRALTLSEREDRDRDLEARKATAPANDRVAHELGVLSRGQLDVLQHKNRLRAAGVAPTRDERAARQRERFEHAIPRRRERVCAARTESRGRERRSRPTCRRGTKTRSSARSADPPDDAKPGEGPARP